MSCPEPPLVETQAVHDTYVSGIARVEPLGRDMFRLTFYTEHNCTFDGRPEWNVVARLVLHVETLRANRAFVTAHIPRLNQPVNDNHQADSR